jgi:ribonuclease D
MSKTLDLPSVPKALIQTPAELAEVCAHLRAAGNFAFDTEFIGEHSYQPMLCLIQVATTARVELIDPLAISRQDMLPFWKLMADPQLAKSCHAGDQDIEIVWQHSGLKTHNLFDTQIGAGMMGVAYPTALWRAVEHFCDVTLEKAHTFSAWDRRPLSKDQFQYAVDDVRYLPRIHTAMQARIHELGHTDWMLEACQHLCTEAAQPVEPRKLFKKIKGAASLNSEQLSVLRELAALREQLAFEHDVPPRTFLKDDALLDIAEKMPATQPSLAAIRSIPRPEVESYGDHFLAAVKAGRAVPADERPTITVPYEDPAEVKRLGEVLWVAAQTICLGQSVTPALVTSQSEVVSLARFLHKKRTIDKHPLMHGWVRKCLGDKLLAFAKGELKIDLVVQDNALHASFRDHH